MVEKAPIGMPDASPVLQTTDFETLGALCFTQLSELRHRGAFSTVAQTFAAFCIRCNTNKETQSLQLPGIWYEVRKAERDRIDQMLNILGNSSLHPKQSFHSDPEIRWYPCSDHRHREFATRRTLVQEGHG